MVHMIRQYSSSVMYKPDLLLWEAQWQTDKPWAYVHVVLVTCQLKAVLVNYSMKTRLLWSLQNVPQHRIVRKMYTLEWTSSTPSLTFWLTKGLLQEYVLHQMQHTHSWRRPLVSQNVDDGVLDDHSNVYIFLTIRYWGTFCWDQSSPVFIEYVSNY